MNKPTTQQTAELNDPSQLNLNLATEPATRQLNPIIAPVPQRSLAAKDAPPSEQLDLLIARLNNAKHHGLPTAMGALTFAGGFAFGVEQAEFHFAGSLELPDLQLGQSSARTRYPVVCAPLSSTYRDMGRHYEAGDRTTFDSSMQSIIDAGVVPDLLVSNPPCSAFAGTGSHGGMEDDIMRFTQYCSFNIGLKLQPKVWMWELVADAYTDPEGRKFIDSVAERVQQHGYKPYYVITTAAQHGGYQNRERFHFVASKIELDFRAQHEADLPEHRGWRSLGECLAQVELARSAGSLMNDEADLGGALKDMLRFCPPGHYLRDVSDEVYRQFYRPYGRNEWNGSSRAGVSQVRGRTDRPCPVIIGGPTVIHPEEHRFLSIRENAAVMGFPLDYPFSDGVLGYKEVGKGLCTHTASFLGRTVLAGLKANVPVQDFDTELTMLLSRSSVPPMTPTLDETEEWWHRHNPDSPLEWSKPREKGKVGRPPGAKNRTRDGVPLDSPPRKTGGLMGSDAKIGTIAVPSHILTPALNEMLRSVNVTAVPYDTDTMSTTNNLMATFTTCETALIVDSSLVLLAAAVCRRPPVATCDVHRLAAGCVTKVERLADDATMATACARALGLSADALIKRTLDGIDPAELMRLLAQVRKAQNEASEP